MKTNILRQALSTASQIHTMQSLIKSIFGNHVSQKIQPNISEASFLKICTQAIVQLSQENGWTRERAEKAVMQVLQKINAHAPSNRLIIISNFLEKEVLVELAKTDPVIVDEVFGSISKKMPLEFFEEQVRKLDLSRRYREAESAVANFDKKLTKPTIILGVGTLALIIILVIIQYFIKS